MQASGAISTVVSATKRVVPIIGDAMVEALRDIARQVRVAKSEHVKLVWVRDDAARQIRWKLEQIRNQCKKIIVIGHVESMLLCAVKENVLSEGDAFNLGGNEIGVETLGLQLSNNVEEKRFRNVIVLKVGRCHSCYIRGAGEIDQKYLFHRSRRSRIRKKWCVGHTGAVPLVYQELMIIHSEDFACSRTSRQM